MRELYLVVALIASVGCATARQAPPPDLASYEAAGAAAANNLLAACLCAEERELVAEALDRLALLVVAPEFRPQLVRAELELELATCPAGTPPFARLTRRTAAQRNAAGLLARPPPDEHARVALLAMVAGGRRATRKD